MGCRSVLVRFKGAVGDIVVLTAAIRDLKLSNPELQIAVDTPHEALWWHNPYLQTSTKAERVLEPDYLPGILASRQGVRKHFLCWFHAYFERELELPCRLTAAKPDLHLSGRERDTAPVELPDTPYWLVFAGGKKDAPVKIWPAERYQLVVDVLQQRGYTFVQSGATGEMHIQPRLKNVVNAVGDKDLRAMLRQIYHAHGVLCPITSAMHIAAAFDKQCVVVAGGREEPWWEAYRNDTGGFPKDVPVMQEHVFLHTIGDLECCRHNGCWRSFLPRDGMAADKTCLLSTAKQTPQCLADISVQQVVDAVLSQN